MQLHNPLLTDMNAASNAAALLLILHIVDLVFYCSCFSSLILGKVIFTDVPISYLLSI